MSVAWVCCVTPDSWLDLSGCFLACEVSLKDREKALSLVRHGLCFSPSLLPEVWERWWLPSSANA